MGEQKGAITSEPDTPLLGFLLPVIDAAALEITEVYSSGPLSSLQGH